MELVSREAGKAGQVSRSYVPRRSNRALSLRGRLVTNLVGFAIVVASLALPLVLGELSFWTEEATKERGIEALYATSKASSLAINQGQTSGRPSLIDQHYYFVNGCVATPVDCVTATNEDWGDYYAELRALYEAATQITAYQQALAFDDWATEHAHFVIALNAVDGARKIEQALRDNESSSSLHMIGTSAGDAAVISYLSWAMRGEVPLDSRVRSVLVIDAPLGFQFPLTLEDVGSGLQASAMKSDVASGIGEWTNAANIAILTIDSNEDVVAHDPVPGVNYDSDPVYLQSDTPLAPTHIGCSSPPCLLFNLVQQLNLGSTWHIYTGSHMAESAREFLDAHWR